MEQAVLNGVFDGGKTESLASALKRVRDREGVTFQALSERTGINRTSISQLVHKNMSLKPEQEARLWQEIAVIEAASKNVDTATITTPPKYRDSIGLYETEEFREAVGWCQYVADRRKMGILVGNPGTGKTTILRHFETLRPGVLYIEAWPNMRVGDLLSEIGRAAGINATGNAYQKTRDVIRALSGRTDITIVIDEAEYLGKWDVDKFEILRKLWDNTGTPVIMCGTLELERKLTRGTGKHNLAQLYRRKIEIKLRGLSVKDAKGILREYNIAPDAAEALSAVVSDNKHGSMGTFVELLELCLEAAEGGQITVATLKSAKRYKLMF